MKSIITTTIFLIIVFGLNQIIYAQNNIPYAELQIKAAVTPMPEAMQDSAKVLGYNKEGELITLREGSNKMICLADDPAEKDRFHVACYHKDLEPFMVRGRELRKEGKSREEVQEIRQSEIESGKIPMLKKPMALYSLTGPGNGYDYSTGTLQEATPLYVLYVPYATEESTGIALKPFGQGTPWLMNPGTPWAHIMISTGQDLGEKEVN